MVDALAQATEWLHRLREQHASTDVTVRDGAAFVVVPATIGRTNFRTMDRAGNLVRITERDFFINADKLVFADELRKPRQGWLIDMPVGSLVLRYEVNSLPGEQVYRNSDARGVCLRIHTKLLGNAP